MNPYKLCSVKAAKDDGIIDIVMTSKTVDRDSEVVLPKGGRLENFMKNPVFLWAHKLDIPAIGKVLPNTISVTEAEMASSVQMDMKDPFGNMVARKYVEGFLSATSIRFLPITVSEPTLQGQRGATINEWELLEDSAVPVPANPQALKKAFGGDDEFGIKDILKTFYDRTDDPTPEGWVKMLNQQENNKDVSIESVYIREITVKSNYAHEQKILAAFINEKVSIPKDAEKLTFTEDGLEMRPHPDAGKVYMRKTVTFLPGIKAARQVYRGMDFYRIYEKSMNDATDEKILLDKRFEVINMGDQINKIEFTNKSLTGPGRLIKDFCEITDLDIEKLKEGIVSQKQVSISPADIEKIGIAITRSMMTKEIYPDSFPLAPDDDWNREDTYVKISDFDVSKFRKMYALCRDGLVGEKNNYKCLHHAIKDGEIVTPWKAVASQMVSLLKTMSDSETDWKYTEEEALIIYNHLKFHYTEFGKEAPEFRHYDKKEFNALDASKNMDLEKQQSPDDETVDLTPELINQIADTVINLRRGVK